MMMRDNLLEYINEKWLSQLVVIMSLFTKISPHICHVMLKREFPFERYSYSCIIPMPIFISALHYISNLICAIIIRLYYIAVNIITI